ncbi:MAG: permease [Actinomycetota bacterium]
MKKEMQEQGAAPKLPLRKRIKWDKTAMVVFAIVLFGLAMVFPDKGEKALDISWEFFKEMVFILPAVMVLMGIFGVWVEREVVVRYLGKGSGASGLLLAILLGTLPTGPLYVAFPLAAMLLKKGARVANAMLFLSSWACIKLPLELMELQFMGWKFTLLRLGLTVAVLIPMALLAEVLYHRGDQGGIQPFGEEEVEAVEETVGLEVPQPGAGS